MGKKKSEWTALRVARRTYPMQLAQCCSRLEALVPEEFPVQFLDEFPGAAYGDYEEIMDLHWGRKKFEDWIDVLVVAGRITLRIGHHQLSRHLEKFGWKSMNDVEVSFDALAVSWKGHMDIRTEVVMNDKLTDKPPIEFVYVHVTLR